MRIFLEGIDGVGKTTIGRHLSKDPSFFYIKEPSSDTFGGAMLAAQPDRSPEDAARLYKRDREEAHIKKVMPALRKGKIVVYDRSFLSTSAYQGARGLDPREIFKENVRSVGLPDLVFYFMAPLDVCVGRILKRGRVDSLYEKPDFLRRVRALYEEILKYPELEGRVIRLDATLSPEKLTHIIKEVCREKRNRSFAKQEVEARPECASRRMECV